MRAAGRCGDSSFPMREPSLPTDLLLRLGATLRKGFDSTFGAFRAMSAARQDTLRDSADQSVARQQCRRRKGSERAAGDQTRDHMAAGEVSVCAPVETSLHYRAAR